MFVGKMAPLSRGVLASFWVLSHWEDGSAVTWVSDFVMGFRLLRMWLRRHVGFLTL